MMNWSNANANLGHTSASPYDNQLRQPKLALSLNDLSFPINDSPVLDLDLTTQFSPILGENEHLFSTEEIEKWFCKRSENGRVIIYDENSQNMFNDMSHVGNEQSRQYKINDHYDQDVDTRSKQNMKSNFKYGPNLGNDLQLVNHDRNVKAHSMALLSNRNNNSQDLIVFNEQFKHSSPLQSFQYFPPPPTSLNMKDIINSGTLSRARTQVSGKMSKRKNWCTSYLVLTKYYLIFFKDQKSAFASKVLKPEFVLGLLQASIEWCPTKSRRKNCFQVSTFQDQVLLHEENGELNSKWFSAIRDCISKLPTPFNSNSKLSMLNDGSSMATQTKLKRSRSTKQYRPNEELELPGGGRNTLSGYATIANPPMNDKKVKIRERLRQFLRMRPTMESLREKGIIKDENVFGCSLDQLCARDKSSIPKFIQQCVEAIEFRDLKADGIYRACGNLSTVQKLRFEINQDNYHGLWKEEDVHVLTGLLKMFFRSMPEPLFPCDRFSLMMKAISIKDSQAKIDAFRKLINDLPPNNYDTLKFILQHLLRIVEYSQENRMSIPNLAIVFGPTLIWPSSDLNNLVLDMMLQMQQSQAIEFLLLEFNTIFD
ncbi:Rho GTPase-activating protein 9 [Blomia tropicalis]|nr:Rho GTPase-activating protein 9 [Blomia tropicalis]